MFEELRGSGSALIQNIVNDKRMLIPIEIYYDFTTGSSLNAFAAKHAGNYLIGISRGSVLLFHDFFNRLFSHPEIARDIGDPKKEVVHPAHSDGISTNIEEIIARRTSRGELPETIAPRNLLRARFAALCVILANNFLIAHEAAHITHGHLAFLNTFGICLIHEGHQEVNAIAKDNLLLQTLEMDADASAVTRSLSELLIRIETGIMPPWMAEMSLTPEDGMFVWSLAILGLFFLFDLIINEQSLINSSHPPHGLRMAMAMGVAASLFEKESPQLRNALSRSLERTALILLECVAKLDAKDGMELVKLATSIKSDAVMQHRASIHQHWKRIRPHLLSAGTFSELAP